MYNKSGELDCADFNIKGMGMVGLVNRVFRIVTTLYLGMLAGIFLSACHSSPPQEVARVYQLTTNTITTHDKDRSVTKLSRALLNYQPLNGDSSSVEAFSITPLLLQYSDGPHGFFFNSFAATESSKLFTDILLQGMVLQPKAGQASELTFTAQQEWDNYLYSLKDLGPVIAPVSELFTLTARVPVNSDVSVGSHFSFSVFPEHQWTVDNLDGNKIHASLDVSHNDKEQTYRRFGKVSFNRHNGWIESLLLVEQMTTGEKVETRRWVLAPEDTPYVSAMLWRDNPDFQDVDFGGVFYDITSESKQYQAFDSSLSQQFMSLPEGVMQLDKKQGDIKLRYIHGMTPYMYQADVTYSDIVLYDRFDKPIDQPLWQHSYSNAFGELELIQSEVNLLPVGLEQVKSNLEAVEYAKAQVTLTPITTEVIQFPWLQLQHQPYFINDARVELTLLNEARKEYKLSVFNGKNQRLYPNFGLLKGRGADTEWESLGPDWLSLGEQMLLEELYGDDTQASISVLLQFDELPETLSLLLLSKQPESKITKSITFVEPHSYQDNLRNPPIDVDSSYMWKEIPKIEPLADSWLSLPITNSVSPWLLDLSHWLKNEEIADKPFEYLYKYLQVKDRYGQLLYPKKMMKSHQQTIKQALIDERWLSFSGAVYSAYYLNGLAVEEEKENNRTIKRDNNSEKFKELLFY